MVMRTLLFAFLMTVSLVRPTKAQANTPKQVATNAEEREVLKTENELEHALEVGDTGVLDRVYSDDFSYTNASGELLSKAQLLADLRTGNHKVSSVSHQDLRLHTYGRTVVMTGISTSTFRYKGIVTSGPRRFTNVYVKQNDQWKLVVHSVTDIAKH
jgi:hypothetical protein